jgi:tRNA threonylcarbamoyladenosine biosynthesis protein TsaE
MTDWSNVILHNPDNSPTRFELADESMTAAFARQLAARLQPGMVIYLRGDLGAGKTTLVRGVLNALGYTGHVKSPTYTLLEPYRVAGLDLRHFDLYRMVDEAEWEMAGFRDEFDGRNIFFIEWPDKARNSLPPADVEIALEILSGGRRIEMAGYTATGIACAKQL